MRVSLSRSIASIALAAATFAVAPSTPGHAQSLSGSFLAARHAVAENDFEMAAYYWRRALIRAPRDVRMMSQALFYSVLAGDMDHAAPLARRLEAEAPDDRVANLVLAVEEIRLGRFDAARERLEVSSGDAVNSLMTRLLLGWARVGAGDSAAAIEEFSSLDNSAIYKVFGRLHAGYAAAVSGEFEAAEAFFAESFDAASTPSSRMVLARAAVLSRSGAWEAAAEVLRAGLANDDANTDLRRAQEAVAAQQALALPVNTAELGASEALFGLAGALSQEQGGRFGLLYAHLALHLRGAFPASDLLIGDILLDLDRFDAAREAYERVPKDHNAYAAAQVGVASSLRSVERTEEAIDALRALATLQTNNASAYFALAQVLSAEQRFDECAHAFDEGLARLGRTTDRHWGIYYRRGICLERMGEWDRAEENFLMALELRPNEPDVLNYLGYSLIEQRRRLDEARGYLERAVAERPDSGYIVDSLGWLYYRIGEYEAAAEKLEEAVRLDPVEPVILDHLGDALWKVGRKLEAEFQWKRSLSFEPTEEDRARILRKLDVGLDQVLAEEKAAAQEPRKADVDGVGGVDGVDGAPVETAPTAPVNGG